ncbi:MAG: helix-turn-helix transcriptional regulator [Desulfuromonadales bacterium]|nr:helix-turn-helix transcriptional regulator [Desulfuromonadales bacterium]
MLKTNVIKIRQLMLGQSITSTDIARECNVCRSYVSHVISGRVKSERIRLKIASKLGKSTDELWPESVYE